MISNKVPFYGSIFTGFAKLPLLFRLEDNEILSVLNCVNAALISKQQGSYIFRTGDSTEVMGLVLTGSALIIQEDLWGHRNILSNVSPGTFFRRPFAARPGSV